MMGMRRNLPKIFRVIDWQEKGGCQELIEPLVSVTDASGSEEINVRRVIKTTGNLWHPAVRVAIKRWRHIVMYHEHFERPGHYKVAHRDWVNIAEEQLRAIGPDGRGIAQRARQLAIKPHDAWVFKVMLGSGIDRRLLLHAHTQISEWRRMLQEIRGNGLSEENAAAEVIQCIENHYLKAEIQGGPLLYDERYGVFVSSSPLQPAATLPLSVARTILIKRMAYDYHFGECEGFEEVTREAWERALSEMTEDVKLEIELSGFIPDWFCAPLIPSPGPTKLDLLLGFFKSKTTVTSAGVSRRGGLHYLTGRNPEGFPRRIPRIEELSNAFDEWRFDMDPQLLKTHRHRRLPTGMPHHIDARYLFPQMNTYRY